MERDYLIGKAWRGEPGDKRNTKYYLAGAAGSGLAGGAVAVHPMTRRIQRVATARATRAAVDSTLAGATSTGAVVRSGAKAALSTPGVKRSFALRGGAGVSGAVAANVAYGAYRKRKRSAS